MITRTNCNNWKQLKKKSEKSTSVYSKNNNKSTVDEYHTDSYQGYQKTGNIFKKLEQFAQAFATFS